jgi:hypothetical protein
LPLEERVSRYDKIPEPKNTGTRRVTGRPDNLDLKPTHSERANGKLIDVWPAMEEVIQSK